MTFYEELRDTLRVTELPCVYSHFRKHQDPPYIAFRGNGQNTFKADNTYYHRQNAYIIEYYFTTKDESNEARIENALLGAGYLYEKSEDLYLEDQGVFLIYYYV